MQFLPYLTNSDSAAVTTQGRDTVVPGAIDQLLPNKRRRLNVSVEDRAINGRSHGISSQDGLVSQHPTSERQTAATFYSDGDPAEYGNHPASSSTTSTAGDVTSWRSLDTASAYPDITTLQQQPYFYPRTNSGTSIYPPSWPGERDKAGATSVLHQAEAMPLFPQPGSAVHSSNAAIVADSTTYHAGIDSASQYSYDGPTLAESPAQDIAARPSTHYSDDASMHLKIQSLPILDNLATQLIHTLPECGFVQVQDLMKGGDSESSQAYKTLKSLFDQTRKVYSRETPFIDAIAIQMFQPSQQEIIRKANIATFISSILGAHDVSFFHLNEFFMETFVPLGHRLLKWQGAIYLELKTQTYISALINSEGRPEGMLEELFPSDLDAQILTRHPDAPSLSLGEQDFIDRSRARKSYLLAEPATKEVLKELPKKYQWTDFVREFATCISRNAAGILNVSIRTQVANGTLPAAKGTQSASDSAAAHVLGVAGSAIQSLSLAGRPTLALQSSSAADARKSSQVAAMVRQPWTKHEEDALLSGLDRVNGPHWSQILALYGRGGSVSEVLKDRNQVQLKDKARNLKLYYLKTGKEVPSSLRGVTGELRKRGGARARAALGSAEDGDAGPGVETEDGEGEADELVADKDGGKRGKTSGRTK